MEDLVLVLWIALQKIMNKWMVYGVGISIFFI